MEGEEGLKETEGVMVVRLNVHRGVAFWFPNGRRLGGGGGESNGTECALCPTLLAHHQVFGMLAFVIIIFLSAAFTDV